MTRLPRGTGFCRSCARRILLTTQGNLFLHATTPSAGTHDSTRVGRVRCNGSMTRHYTPGPDFTYKETP